MEDVENLLVVVIPTQLADAVQKASQHTAELQLVPEIVRCNRVQLVGRRTLLF